MLRQPPDRPNMSRRGGPFRAWIKKKFAGATAVHPPRARFGSGIHAGETRDIRHVALSRVLSSRNRRSAIRMEALLRRNVRSELLLRLKAVPGGCPGRGDEMPTSELDCR